MTTAPHTARIFCIGQNYVAHIRELGNPMPEAPVIFMRPLSCLVAPGEAVHFPRHGKELHYEVEVVVRIGKEGRDIDESNALAHIDALTLGAAYAVVTGKNPRENNDPIGMSIQEHFGRAPKMNLSQVVRANDARETMDFQPGLLALAGACLLRRCMGTRARSRWLGAGWRLRVDVLQVAEPDDDPR